MAIDLKFNYGTKDISTVSKVAGNIYIKKIVDATNENKDNGRARLYIDTPVSDSGNIERLSIGGDVYVGKATEAAAAGYDVVIDPDGEVIDNVVTSIQRGGLKLKIEKATGNVDTYSPSTQGLGGNTIIFVVE